MNHFLLVILLIHIVRIYSVLWCTLSSVAIYFAGEEDSLVYGVLEDGVLEGVVHSQG